MICDDACAGIVGVSPPAKVVRRRTREQVERILREYCRGCPDYSCLAKAACAHADLISLGEARCGRGRWGEG